MSGQRSDDFTFNPPRNTTRLRSFTNRSRYRMMSGMTASTGAQLGSNSSLASSLSSSLTNLIDPAKFLTMQDDAHSRRISSEIMKQCLYESVVSSPYRRQQRRRMSAAVPSEYRNSTPCGYSPMTTSAMNSTMDPVDTGFYDVYGRMVQSLPVTPAASKQVTPSQSPTSAKKFRAFMAAGCGPQWEARREAEEGRDGYRVREDSWKGLPSLFRPCPRYIPAGELSESDVTRCESLEMLHTRSDGFSLGNPDEYMIGNSEDGYRDGFLRGDGDDDMEIEVEERGGFSREGSNSSVIRLNTPPRNRSKISSNSNNT